MKVAVLYNRKSGRGANPAVEASIVDGLKRMGHEVELFVPNARGQMTELSKQAAASGHELLVAVGGDGTLNEVINGCLGQPVKVGVIPLGTVNVFARSTGIPLDVAGALNVIATGAPRKVTLGKANERAFIFTAGIGLDSEVLSQDPVELKKIFGRYSYYIKAAQKLPLWRAPRLSISFDGEAPVTCQAVILGKTRLYGDRFLLTPHASPFDPQIDACMWRDFSAFKFVRVAAASTFNGGHLTDSCIAYRKFSRATITTDDEAHIHVDGEYLSRLPVEIQALPDALDVVLPVPA